MADDDKKRTQEASETNFTTRGGRQDETSGAGKPWTSPCKRRPETPPPDADPDAETVVGPPLPALTDLGLRDSEVTRTKSSSRAPSEHVRMPLFDGACRLALEATSPAERAVPRSRHIKWSKV